MMKLRKLKEGRYVSVTEKRRGVNRVLVGNMKERGKLGRRRARWDDKIKWILNKWDGRA
jgi:hypothetical protein